MLGIRVPRISDSWPLAGSSPLSSPARRCRTGRRTAETFCFRFCETFICSLRVYSNDILREARTNNQHDEYIFQTNNGEEDRGDNFICSTDDFIDFLFKRRSPNRCLNKQQTHCISSKTKTVERRSLAGISVRKASKRPCQSGNIEKHLHHVIPRTAETCSR